MTESSQQSWQIRKAAISSDIGLVASQHYMASDAGAKVLKQGGNAIDAAIATGLVLGAVEPWMSGIGGGGYMTVYVAETREVSVVEFGMCAPRAATPDDYPLAGEGENASDAFNWPKVIGDTNIHGPLSIAVPGYIRGIELALKEYGSWSWQEVFEPACQQAESGLPIDWYSAQKVNHFARYLNLYPETRRVYLGDGLPPAANIDGTVDRLQLGNLSSTYRTLQRAGPDEFYNGALAKRLVEDLKDAGSRVDETDLLNYQASINTPLQTDYRDHTLFVSGSLTAGPSIIHALGELSSRLPSEENPGPTTYKAYADSLFAAYEYRLKNLGAGENPAEPGNTSHICVADQYGNVVSLTQTVMSAFGSRIMLPRSGVLMNNGMMWFDPRPGGPNSVVGGRKPLCNMCPVILRHSNGAMTAIGACGGRRIFPAVFQLASFMTDYDMTVDEAVHQPRLDVSGTDLITVMDQADAKIIDTLQRQYSNVSIRPYGVYPNLFALPQIVKRDNDGRLSGGCFVPSPHAKVSASDDF